MQQDYRRAGTSVPDSQCDLTQVHAIETESVKHQSDATRQPGSPHPLIGRAPSRARALTRAYANRVLILGFRRQ